MIISQHADARNILGKQQTDVEQYAPAVELWDSGFTYNENDIVNYNGKLYKSLQSNNTNQQPDTEVTYWETLNIEPHADQHITTEDEIDGDKLDVDFTPSNYTPDASPAEAGDVDDLSAHLKGIDTALGSSSSGGGAQGIESTILSGETEAEVMVSGLFNRAAVTGYGISAVQRAFYVKSVVPSGIVTYLTVGMDSSYTEDLDFHAVLANEE